MAVLCEGISVIVRRDSIDEYFAGGWEAFEALVPNATLCTDGELARVGFMEPGGVEHFVSDLVLRGLVFYGDECHPEDIAVADQVRGLTRPCDWLEYGRFGVGENPEDKVAMCWLYEGKRDLPGVIRLKSLSMELHAPPGWRYQGSLSQQFGFVPDEDRKDRLKFLRSEEKLDVYLDRATGKEVFVGRSGRTPKTVN